MEKQVAILDQDKAYLQRLLEGLNRMERRSFRAVSVMDGMKDVALLIVSSEALDLLPKDFTAGETVILTDVQGYLEINHRKTIYKYQGISQMAAQIEAFLTMVKETPQKVVQTKSRTTFLGVSSPIGRSFKTSFSIVLGQLLAQQYQTLYVNLEPVSGAEVLYPFEWHVSLSDVLYACHAGEERVNELLSETFVSFHGLDLLGPAAAAEDILKTTPVELREAVQKYCEMKGYEYVVLDIGCDMNLLEVFWPLLEKLYVPGRKDPLSEAKLKEFFTWISKISPTARAEAERVDLPSGKMVLNGKNYLDSLLFSEMGDYVRDLLSRARA